MTPTMINWQPANLEDDVIKLIPVVATDFERLFKVASDPLIWEQHPSSDRYKSEVFQLYFDSAITSQMAFLITDKTTDDIIGCTRYYDYKPGNPSIAIGFTFLAKAYWGGLYNNSTKKLLLDYAFQYVDKVYFHVGAENIRSQKGTMKIGAVKVNELNMESNGKPQLHYEYLIQKENWK